MNTSEVLGNPESLEFAGNMLERHDFQDQTPSLLDVSFFFVATQNSNLL